MRTADASCDSHLSGLYNTVLKRMLDLMLAGGMLAVVAPVLPFIALAIRRDSPGPVFFRQTRIGRDGHVFRIWKFRTMVHERGEELRFFATEDGEYRHKFRNDPRVTRVGAFLRRTSLDELPQLLNVLTGDMSVVGPRPEIPHIVQNYQPWQHRRHLVRPGMTGWWQVNGRSDRPMHEHTELDVHYVDHLSWRLDLRILWRTFRFVVRHTGAF